MRSSERLGLTFSGGGFRATLFHLGVVRLLYDSGLLSDVKRIGAVSGGSILAAHLVLNWERYTGPRESFDEAAKELLDFTRKDIRGRVIRRWFLAWLAILPRLLKRRHWTFTNLLQREYRGLFGEATLSDLNPTEEVARPQVFFFCTSLTTGRVCSFGRSGFMWDEDGEERSIIAPSLEISFAVAASSAFPPLFPPIAISNRELFCSNKDFSHPQYLTDGGVYDNLGIDRLLWYHKNHADLDRFLISDAEGAFDWDFSKQYTFIVTRNVRASNILMKRVSQLLYDSVPYGTDVIVIDIEGEIQKPSTVLPIEIQRELRNVRTDLDAFSSHEASALIQHGYGMARERLIEHGVVGRDAPALAWEPVVKRRATTPSIIRKGRARRLRVWSFRDWVSWVTLMIVLAIVVAIVMPPYLRQARLAQAVEMAGELRSENKTLSDLNRTLNTVATGYFRQRHRPVEVGSSAAHRDSTAGSICCVVQLRGGGDRRFLLGGYAFAPEGAEQGDPILQPGPIDGGRAPEDVVALLNRFFPMSAEGRMPVASIAELRPEIQATNTIKGLGDITGVAENVTMGQEVFVAGRTTGIRKGIVVALGHTVLVRHIDDVYPIRGLIALESSTDPTAGLTTGGDNGAPVVTIDGRLVGIVVGGSSQVSFAMPIKNIFEALGVELDRNG